MGNITLTETTLNETFCCCLCKPEEKNHKYIPIFPSKVNFSDYIYTYHRPVLSLTI